MEYYKVKVRAKQDIEVTNSAYTILKKGAIVRLNAFDKLELDMNHKPYPMVFYRLDTGNVSITFGDHRAMSEYSVEDFEKFFEEVEQLKLTAESVCGVYDGCVCDSCGDNDLCKKVEGVKLKTKFYKDRLEDNANDIADLCDQLPKDFRKNTGGGGWSFLNMCMRNDGIQWTGLHETMDKLLTLGIAIGKLSYLLPKDMWSILPGGMPYVAVNENI